MLDPKEEKKFKELRNMCRELKVPSPPEIHIGLQVHDHNGVLIFDDKQRGHSWTRNFYNYMLGTLSDAQNAQASFGAGYLSGKTTAGTIRGTAGYTPARASNLTANSGFTLLNTTNVYGIVVGTGDTAFSVDHYALATQIAAGTGGGQLSHVAMSNPTAAYTGGTKTWKTTIFRIFNNNSGVSITVKEVGLFWIGSICYASNEYYMLERSVLSPTVAVANGAQLTVTYEISMDFSAID
jgi:hypothetical protein